MTSFNSILIIGLGLIGGSLAKRIKKYYPDITLYGIAPSENTRQLATESMLFEAVFDQIKHVPKTIDCVFVCTPIELVAETIMTASNHIDSPCMFTDVASVKESIVNAVDLNKNGHVFIPGHPMAGTEHVGFASSTDSIFTNSSYILIQTKDDHSVLKAFLEALEVKVVETDAITHDKMIALASHFPYVVTTLLMSVVADLSEQDQQLFKQLMGPGFKDTTRIAASSPEWGYDVCQNNLKHVNELLTIFENNITLVKGKLNQDSTALKTFFKDIQAVKKALN